MRKKILYLLSIVILAVALCVALVGCAPSRPDRFIEKLLSMEKWSIEVTNSKGETVSINARNKNLFWDMGTSAQTYTLIDKEAVEIYRYKDGVWTYTFVNDAETVKTYRKRLEESASDVYLPNGPDLKEVKKDFLDKYRKTDGKWYEINTNPAYFYVKGDKLIYKKYDNTISYILGSKISIPKEAKKAKEDAIKNAENDWF